MKVLKRLNKVTAATDKEVEYFRLLKEDWKEFESAIVKPFISLVTSRSNLVIKEYRADQWIVDRVFYSKNFMKMDHVRVEFVSSGKGLLYLDVYGSNEWGAGLSGVPFSVKSPESKDYIDVVSAYSEVLKLSEKDIKKAWDTISKDIKDLLKKKKLI